MTDTLTTPSLKQQNKSDTEINTTIQRVTRATATQLSNTTTRN